jgi:hypothetical protein
MEKTDEEKKYTDKLMPAQRKYFPLPYLMAKRNTYDDLRPESVKIGNKRYGTEDFLTFHFYKNVSTPLPPEILEHLKIEKL